MLLHRDKNDLYHLLSVSLIRDDGSIAGQYGLETEKELIQFLKDHPDETFLLQPGMGLTRRIEDDRAKYTVEDGHIFAGEVLYDSKAGKIVCKESR
ncbi:MAG: hypothetical protein AB7K24_17900 [Gemmataceae bacterium]